MTRRDLIQKWLTYGLGLLPVWLADAYILPRYPLWGVTPMLLPLAAAAVAVLEGAYAGTGFGLAVGLLWELAYPGGFGGLVFFLALAGMVMGAVSQYASPAVSSARRGCWACWGSFVWPGACSPTPPRSISCSRWLSRNFSGPWPGPPWSGCSSGLSTAGWAERDWRKDCRGGYHPPADPNPRAASYGANACRARRPRRAVSRGAPLSVDSGPGRPALQSPAGRVLAGADIPKRAAQVRPYAVCFRLV